MLSTQNLALMPGIGRLRQLSQALALLDAILCPSWEYRFYSFQASWSPDAALASMRDGSGDEYFLLFTAAGALLKGFAHTAPMSSYAQRPPRAWPGVLDALPAPFAALLDDPALCAADTTFCIWRGASDAAWRRGPVSYPAGPDPDGSARLLAILDGNPQTYHAYAEAYYERPVSLAAVAHLYDYRPLTPEIVDMLAPGRAAELQADLDEIQYPSAGRL